MLSFSSRTPSALLTLSLHDALPISGGTTTGGTTPGGTTTGGTTGGTTTGGTTTGGTTTGGTTTGGGTATSSLPSTGTKADRKSTRLNSSHLGISYAVFCLKKKKPTK